jgi:hypothetical protein
VRRSAQLDAISHRYRSKVKEKIMKPGISLTELNHEVQRQAAARVDYLVNTQASLRLVPMKDYPHGVALVSLDTAAAELQRWELTSTAHDQIASWLEIPRKYYDRLLVDHLDMLIANVNGLFEREPGTRMVRTLDGKCRAFMSDRYRRLDNDEVLASVLPHVLGAGKAGARSHEVIRSVITENQMALTVVFTDPSLRQNLGKTARGDADDIVIPGFRIENSEIGKSSLKSRGFFYRTYCKNGCVFGADGEFSFQRNHAGAKLSADMERIVLTDETRRAADAALLLELRDMINAIGNPDVTMKWADQLRAAKTGDTIVKPIAAIEQLAKACGLLESEKDTALENLIAEADYSRFGAMNAITAIANQESVSYDRALELEEIGGSLLTMSQHEWNRIANTQRVAVAA